MNNKARLDYVDFAKGIGMLAVIWGHIMDVGWSHSLIYGFHMPLFFFLSGMMFRKEKFPSFSIFLKRRFQSLIKPYLIISFATWGIWGVYNFVSHGIVESYIKSLLQTFIAQGPGNYLVHNAPLWFIPCLFFVEIVYFFICKNELKINIILCFICATLGWAMVQQNDFCDLSKLPWNMDYGLSVLPFYALGNLLIEKLGHQKIVEYIKQRQFKFAIIAMILTILPVISVNCYGFISLASSLRKMVVWPYSVALCGILFTMIIAVLVNFDSIKKHLQIIITPILFIGRNCLFFLAFHCPIKGFVIVLIAKFFKLGGTRVVQTNMSYSLIAFLISLAITAIVVSAVNYFIMKEK